MHKTGFVHAKRGAFRFSFWDAAAIVLLAVFVVYHIYLAHIGMNNEDEPFYLSVAHRLLHGDALIADEWGLTQGTSLFQMIPLWLFYKISDNADGIILFFRYVFIVTQTLFGVFLYRVQRKDKFLALFSLMLFLSFIPCMMMALSYYFLSIIFALYIGTRLFLQPAKTNLQQVCCGFVYALLVLVQPLTVLLYPMYTVIVFAGSRKKGGVRGTPPGWRSRSFWTRSTVGISIAAVLFCLLVISRSSVRELIEAVPKLLQDSEYPIASDFWGVLTRFTHKGLPLSDGAHEPLMLCILLLPPMAAVLLRSIHKLQSASVVLLFTAAALLVFLYLSTQRWRWGQYPLMSFVWFGLICGLLTETKDRKALSFYGFGLLFALLMNISSDYEQGLGTVVCAVVCPQLCWGYAQQARFAVPVRRSIGNIQKFMRYKRRRQKLEHLLNRGMKPLIAACLCAVFVSQLFFWVHEGWGDYCLDVAESFGSALAVRDPDAVYSVKLTRGPYRGVTTTAECAKKYTEQLQDLDQIRAQLGEGDTCYIASLLTWGYYYLQTSRYTPDTPYFVFENLNTRQFLYWELHPDKIPDFIYVEKADPDETSENEKSDRQAVLQMLQEHFACQTTEGKRGYILHLTGEQEPAGHESAHSRTSAQARINA